jgi:hypothetical protein
MEQGSGESVPPLEKLTGEDLRDSRINEFNHDSP